MAEGMNRESAEDARKEGDRPRGGAPLLALLSGVSRIALTLVRRRPFRPRRERQSSLDRARIAVLGEPTVALGAGH